MHKRKLVINLFALGEGLAGQRAYLAFAKAITVRTEISDVDHVLRQPIKMLSARTTAKLLLFPSLVQEPPKFLLFLHIIKESNVRGSSSLAYLIIALIMV